MLPTSLSFKQDSLACIRPPNLQGFFFPPADFTFDVDPVTESNLSKLKSKQSFNHAFFAWRDICDELVKNGNVASTRIDILEFQEATLDLHILHIPIVHRLYFHIWRISKSISPEIEGDRWGEFHAFDDPEILLSSMKAVLLELLPLRIQEDLTRLESPIRKAKSHSLEEITDEYKKLFERYLLFFENPASNCHESIEAILEKIRVESPSWARRKESITGSCLEAHKHPLFNKSLFWLTGSSTHSLAGVLKSSELPSCDYTPSLIPTGMLLKEGITPLSGELGDGISQNGVNMKHLSGVLAEAHIGAFSYATQSAFYFDKDLAISTLLEMLKSFSEAHISSLSCTDFSRLKIALIRAFEYADLPSESLVFIKFKLSQLATSDELQAKAKTYLIDDLLPFISKLHKTPLRPEIEAIVSSRASALIYGISEESEENSSLINRRITGDVKGETSLKGPLKLGSCVDFAITSCEIARLILNRILPFEVLSLDAGRYLLSRQGKED
jgi:hypothetical protein